MDNYYYRKKKDTSNREGIMYEYKYYYRKKTVHLQIFLN